MGLKLVPYICEINAEIFCRNTPYPPDGIETLFKIQIPNPILRRNTPYPPDGIETALGEDSCGRGQQVEIPLTHQMGLKQIIVISAF